MKATRLLAPCALALSLATAVHAQDPEPGSALCYPSVRQMGALTIVSVTNTDPASSVLARFRYVQMVPSTSGDVFIPDDCLIDTSFHFLTPNDTITVSVACDSGTGRDGYLMVDAVDPASLASISFNRLIGSEWVAQGGSATYSLPAISFQSPLAQGAPTDLDGDGELDFDLLEYTACPEELYIDQFLASIGNRLAMINLTGGTQFIATASFVIFNDNEQPFVAERKFRCWFDQPLDFVDGQFSLPFLLGTVNDPAEFDYTCDGVGDLETGWARIRGVIAESPTSGQIIQQPAFLGAVTGTTLGFERGRPLWRRGNALRGDFLGTAPIHPEY